MYKYNWACPNCRYLVGHNVILQGEHYYPCPRCNKTTLVEFEPAHRVRLKFSYRALERKMKITGKRIEKLREGFAKLSESIVKTVISFDD